MIDRVKKILKNKKTMDKITQNKYLDRLKRETTICELIGSGWETVWKKSIDPEKEYSYPQKKQREFKELASYWEKKWEKFGNKWSQERQNYRLLQSAIYSFYFSFKVFKSRYSATVRRFPTGSGEEEKKTRIQIHADEEMAAANLKAMYLFGKQGIDLLRKLDIKLSKKDKEFSDCFKKTRNLFFEHNFDPKGYQNFLFEPETNLDTGCYLEINIYLLNENLEKEESCITKINYYDDYFKLENIFLKKLKKNKILY